jgi:hypothetical protein
MNGIGRMGCLIEPPPLKAWRWPRASTARLKALPPRVVQPCLMPTDTQWVGSCTINSSADGLVAMSGIPWGPSINAGYWFARSYSGFPSTDDAGAYPEDVAKMLAEVGLGSVLLHSDDPAKWTMIPDLEYREQAKDHRIGGWYRAFAVEDVRDALDRGYAVMVAMKIRESFGQIRNDGMWRKAAGTVLGGHQMRLYGYDNVEVGGVGYAPGCFHLRQHWGPWGELVKDHGALGRGSLRLPYEAFRTEGVQDVIVYSSFDKEAGK